MQSDHGAGAQNPDGNESNDDALWLDLVARLQEPDDSFLDADPSEPSAQAGSAERSSDNAHDHKKVGDFDPLGVWHLDPSAPARDQRDEIATDPARNLGPRDYVVEDEEDDFVPAEPPKLSSSEPALVAAWLGAAGGPLLLIVAAVFWRQLPVLLVIAIVVAFVIGTGYLLFRLPNHRDPDDGDGAVV